MKNSGMDRAPAKGSAHLQLSSNLHLITGAACHVSEHRQRIRVGWLLLHHSRGKLGMSRHILMHKITQQAQH
jgi:hypothetical protein